MIRKLSRGCLKRQYGPVFYTCVDFPQGSVISPVLFSIYLQKMFQEIISKGVKYADIWITGNDVNALVKDIEEGLTKICSMSIKWSLG